MKKNRFLFILGIAALPLLSGCPDDKSVTTIINKDGSCVRTVGNFDPRDFEGIDSVKHNLPIPVDHSWKLEVINDSTSVLLGEFESVDELNKLYFNDESKFKVYNRNVGLEKKFRWFHTLFIYRETYGGVLTRFPITNYMSKEEAHAFKNAEPKEDPFFNSMDSKARESLLDNIEERGGIWLHDNMMAIVFDDIIEIANNNQIISKKDIDINALRDSMKYKIDKSDKVIISFDFSDDQLDMRDLAKLIGEEMGLDSTTIKDLVQKVELTDLEEKYDNEIFASFVNDYHNEVFMPGQLTDANADEIRGDTLYWDVGFAKYMDSDYVMIAESKVTNRWAYVVSGFIVLLALIIPFLKRIKRSS